MAYVDPVAYLKGNLSRLISFLVYEIIPNESNGVVLKEELLAYRRRGLTWADGYPPLQTVDLGQPNTTLWRLRATGVIFGAEQIPADWVEPKDQD